jgi:hypothetical protein
MLGGYGRGRALGLARRCAILFPVAVCATSAHAVGLSSPRASVRISAGQVEVVALEPATAGVEERELVLSLAGGKTFPVRLTGEIEPDDPAASWRVPALPTEHAVLALREGGGGFEEEIVAVSAEFVIVAGSNVSAEKLWFRDGEWKTREADSGHRGLPSPHFGSTGPERWTPLDEARAFLEMPVRARPAGKRDIAAPGRGAMLEPLPGGSPPELRLSSFLPLRE